MDHRSITIEFETLNDLKKEFTSNLIHGGTFVHGVTDVSEREEVELVIRHPEDGGEIQFPASVVWVKEGEGVGLSIKNFGPDQREEISGFMLRSLPSKLSRPPVDLPEGHPSDAAAPDALPPDPTSPEDDSPRRSGEAPKPLNLHERLRGLSGPEQQKIAKGVNANERIVLERIYGKMVWEAILRNPQVTVPEVARIAKMGALPKHLFEVIGANTALLRVPQVRRALLGNPKTPLGLVDKVLRLAPHAELRVIPRQPGYPQSVRERARRLLQNT